MSQTPPTDPATLGQSLNGAQLQAMQKQMAEGLQKIVAKLEFREKALDQACRVCEYLFRVPGLVVDIKASVDLAQSMFEFLTADLPKPDLPPNHHTPPANS